MKFVISSSTLSSHLLAIGRVIVPKNNIHILDCFCFDISGKLLTITASDNDTTLITTIELAECDQDIRFAINAKTLQDSIKEIPEQPLEIYLNTESYEVTIEYQNGQYKMMAQSADEFPLPILDEEKDTCLTLPAQGLLTDLTRALVATANDQLRPQLSAVCFDVRDNSLSIASSNGNQLTLTCLTQISLEGEGTFLLAQRPASLLKTILGKEQGDVVINFNSRGATFITTDYKLICRLVEGRYPNFRSVIPQNNNNVATLNRQALVSVLRRVMIFANQQSVLIKFRISGNTLNISSQDIDFGKSAEENMLCDYNGVDMRIAFKGSIFLDLIQSLDSEEICLKIADPSRAGLIVPSVQEENHEVTILTMPSVFSD